MGEIGQGWMEYTFFNRFQFRFQRGWDRIFRSSLLAGSYSICLFLVFIRHCQFSRQVVGLVGSVHNDVNAGWYACWVCSLSSSGPIIGEKGFLFFLFSFVSFRVFFLVVFSYRFLVKVVFIFYLWIISDREDDTMDKSWMKYWNMALKSMLSILWEWENSRDWAIDSYLSEGEVLDVSVIPENVGKSFFLMNGTIIFVNHIT